MDLCAVGDLCWSVILPVSHMPLAGEFVQVKSPEHIIGNDAAIVSLQTARLGLHCSLLATNAIAKRDGFPLLELLQEAGVETAHIHTEGAITPTSYFLQLAGTDERAGLIEDYEFHSPINRVPASRFAYIDIYEEHISERLALVESWSRANTRCLVNLSSSNLIKKAQLLSHISNIDTLQMSGSGSIDDARTLGWDILQLCPATCAVVTLGARGAVVVDRQGSSVIKAKSVQTLRTIGAGATFSASFLYTLAQGVAHREAATIATQKATEFCTDENNPLEALKR